MKLSLVKAVASGRSQQKALTREQILVRLLRKRAYANAAGMKELENILRNQIMWALPIHDGSLFSKEEPDESGD